MWWFQCMSPKQINKKFKSCEHKSIKKIWLVGKDWITCKVVSLISRPPADIFMTNSSSSFLLLVNRYAASGFSLELMNCIESSTLLTFTKEQQDLLKPRISPRQKVLSTDYKQNFLQISCLSFVNPQKLKLGHSKLKVSLKLSQMTYGLKLICCILLYMGRNDIIISMRIELPKEIILI